MKFFRLVSHMLVPACLALLLSGCIGGVSGLADLREVASPVAPVSEGQYVSLLNDDGAVSTMFVPTDVPDEFYVWDPGIAPADENLKVTFFEPVEGIYIAQIRSLEDEDPILFRYSFVRIVRNRIQVSTDDLARLVGEELFTVLGSTLPGDPDVNTLTDNAYLNWAILQRVALSRARDIEYEDFVLRLAGPTD